MSLAVSLYKTIFQGINMSETMHPPLPHTVNSLADEFAACGLGAGQTVVVHSAMGKIGGYIVGGAETVIQAPRSKF